MLRLRLSWQGLLEDGLHLLLMLAVWRLLQLSHLVGRQKLKKSVNLLLLSEASSSSRSRSRIRRRFSGGGISQSGLQISQIGSRGFP